MFTLKKQTNTCMLMITNYDKTDNVIQNYTA